MIAGTLLLVAAVSLAMGALSAWLAPRGWLISMLASSAALLGASICVLAGEDWQWQSSFSLGGEIAQLRLDALSAFFLALLAVVGGAAALFASEHWSERSHPRSAPWGRIWWCLLVACLAVVLLSANGLHFLIAWELFTLAAYYLITLDRSPADVRAAGWLYLGASHAAVLSLFAFFAALAASTGSWSLGPMRERTELAPLFWLALLGFGLKAGLFPLHIWLPSAHANAPSHVSAMLSGVTIKLGIYGILRFSAWLPVPTAAGWSIAVLGMASAVLGVAFALAQHDLKRLLAYHSVENIGIILIGSGFALLAAKEGDARWGSLALAGALLHVWNHGLFKALLFLGAGSVLHATGTREMSQLGGLWRRMPWTSALFALGAVAICGLPPLNGFVSEWLVFLGLFDAADARGPSAWISIPAAILLGMTGALALACFAKVCGVVFLGAPRTARAAAAHDSGSAARSAMLILAFACLALGLAPALVWPALERVVISWQPKWAGAAALAPLTILGWIHVAFAVLAAASAACLWRRIRRHGVKRSMTWDCGYAVPTARMQYTAGSFASTLNEWFGWILHPRAHEHRPVGPFPSASSVSAHSPETVLERVVEPAGGWILRASLFARRIQHGRVQTYLFYLLLGIALLAALVVTAAAP